MTTLTADMTALYDIIRPDTFSDRNTAIALALTIDYYKNSEATVPENHLEVEGRMIDMVCGYSSFNDDYMDNHIYKKEFEKMILTKGINETIDWVSISKAVMKRFPCVSRYGRVRKPSDIAKAYICAYYNEESYVNGYMAYAPVDSFIHKNFQVTDGCNHYAFEDDFPGAWHTQWSLTGQEGF